MRVQETLDRLGLYWKRDPDFVPVKDAATVRLNVSIGGGSVELLATWPKWYDTRKEQGGGLRPSSCPHSLRLGRSEGIKRLSRHKRCPPTGYPLYSTVRLTPSPLVGGPWRRFLDVALPAPFLTFSKRAVGPFLAGAGRRAESSAFRSTAGRQRAEGEASARCFTKNEQPTGQRYVTKTARISYLYCVSYLY